MFDVQCSTFNVYCWLDVERRTSNEILDMAKKKFGLVLGGGGARGLAHVGVIKALESAGLVPDLVVGASMGAIIGGAYALFADSRKLEEKVLRLVRDRSIVKLEALAAQRSEEEKEIIFQKLATFVANLYLWNLRAINGFITEGSQFKKIIDLLIEGKKFSDTKIKFACTALDINWGKEVLFTEGSLSEAIFSSMAIPGVFPPVKNGDKLLVDGGIINLAPVAVAKQLGAEVVVAVDVSLDIKPAEFKNGHDILFRTDMIKEKELSNLKMQAAEVIVRPDVGDYSWARFSGVDSLVQKGEAAIKSRLAEIEKKIYSRDNLKNRILNYLRPSRGKGKA